MKLKHLTLALMASSFILSCGNREDEINNELPMYEPATQIPIAGKWKSTEGDLDFNITNKQGNTPAMIVYKYLDGVKHSEVYVRTTLNTENTIYYKQGDLYYPIKWSYNNNQLTINITWAYGGFSQKPVYPY